MIEKIISDYSFTFIAQAPPASFLIGANKECKFQSQQPTDWTVLIDYQFLTGLVGDLIAPCSINLLPEASHQPGATGTTFLDRGQTGIVLLRVPQVGGTYRFFGSMLTIRLNSAALSPGNGFIAGIRAFPKSCYLPYTLPYGPFIPPTDTVRIPKFATHYNISPYILGVQVRSHTGSVLQTTVDPLVNSSEFLPLPPGAHDIFDAAGAFASTLVSFRLHG